MPQHSLTGDCTSFFNMTFCKQQISDASSHRGAPKTAVVFPSWEPYHAVRLRVIARQVPVVAIIASAAIATHPSTPVTTDGAVPPCVTLLEEGDPRRWRNISVWRRMTSCLDQYRPQCVVIPGWSGACALAALQWCMIRRVPAVCMADSTAWDWRRTPLKEWHKKHLLSAFSTALAAGTATRDYLHELGMSEDRIFLGYNAVDNAYFQSATTIWRGSEWSLREELALKRPFFLFVGRLIPEKNLFRMMDAYAQYRTQVAKQRDAGKVTAARDMVVLGDGQLYNELTAHISALGLAFSSPIIGIRPSEQDGTQAIIHLRGFTRYEELPKYYALADAAILASQKDTWGLVINEAMASGLPVIVSRRCGCSLDLVREGENGYLVDPFDVNDMATKMMRMTQLSAEQRQTMGARSHEIVQGWGPGRFADGLKAAIEKALQVGPGQHSGLDCLLLPAAMIARSIGVA